MSRTNMQRRQPKSRRSPDPNTKWYSLNGISWRTGQYIHEIGILVAILYSPQLETFSCLIDKRTILLSRKEITRFARQVTGYSGRNPFIFLITPEEVTVTSEIP